MDLRGPSKRLLFFHILLNVYQLQQKQYLCDDTINFTQGIYIHMRSLVASW